VGSIQAAQIGVPVKDGVVTLSGEVSSYTEKWKAERAAQRVSGVNALAVDLKVKLTGTGQRTDADIARSVETGLEWSTSAGAVKVMVENGVVTQFGRVAGAACGYERPEFDSAHSSPACAARSSLQS
jgi:osmotically-inducible protein OsmY